VRAKFRNDLGRPEAMVPDQVTPLHFSMPDVLHTFKAGHRIMIQIQSSWFPLVDRNPQRFTDIYQASPPDFHKATERVYRSSPDSSSVLLRVWNAPPEDFERTP